MVRGAPTNPNLESHEAPKGVEIRDKSKFSKATLNPQARGRCLFAEGSAFTKPRAVSAVSTLHAVWTDSRKSSVRGTVYR